MQSTSQVLWTRNISIHLPRIGKARHRPFCITSVSPDSILHVMDTRYSQQRQGCISDLLGASKRVRFSPILTDRSCIKQSSIRTSNSDLSNSCMANKILVSKTITNVFENTCVAHKGYRTFVKWKQGNSSIINSWHGWFSIKIVCRSNFRRICCSYNKCKANRHKHSLQIALA